MAQVSRATIKKTGLFIAVVAVLFVFLAPSTAAASSQLASDLEQAFLGPGESVDSTYELLFGIVLPFLLVFAIIHYAMKNIWPDNEKEATIIALVLALFPIPTGAYQLIGEVLLALSDVVAKAEAPRVAFKGTVLAEFIAPLEDWQARAALSLGFGAILTLILSLFGTGGEKRTLKKHEAVAVAVLTGAFWLAIGGYDEMTQMGGFAVIMLVGVALLGAHLMKGGGIGGHVTGFMGLIILGWAFERLPVDQYGPLQEFGNMILQGAMWIVGAIVFIIVGILVMVTHLKSK